MTAKSINTCHDLHALVWKEVDLFVAKTVEVELASQGKTKAEALKNLEEAINLYFEDEKISSDKISPLNQLELHPVKTCFHYA